MTIAAIATVITNKNLHIFGYGGFNDPLPGVLFSAAEFSVAENGSMATITVVDNDQPPTVHFNSATYSVAENGGTATITVMLGAASGQSVTVDYATSDGTAVSGTLSFAPGETSRTFTVPITVRP